MIRSAGVRSAILALIASPFVLAPSAISQSNPSQPGTPATPTPPGTTGATPGATAETAEGDVATPTGTVNITGDAEPVAAQLSLRAGAELGRRLGEEVADRCAADGRIFVTSRNDVSALAAERLVFLKQAALRTESAKRTSADITSLIEEVLGKGKDQAVAPPGMLVEGLETANLILGGAASAFGFLKSDYAIHTTKVEPQDEVVLAAAASVLKTCAIREGWSIPTENSEPLVKLNALTESVREGVAKAAGLKILDSKMTDAQKVRSAMLQASLADHAAFLTASLQPAGEGKPGLLQRVVNADAIFRRQPKYILYAEFVQAGAMAVSRTHMFVLNPRLTFVGFAAVTYTLLNADGVIDISGTGICNWPLPRMKLQEIGRESNTFNKGKPQDLQCKLDSLELEPAPSTSQTP